MNNKKKKYKKGVIMFEMLTGCRCFNGGDNQYEVRSNILNKNMEQWPLDLGVSSNGMDFFNKLLEYEPLKRYSCQQALRHDWLIDIFQHRSQYLNNNSPNQFISPRLTPLAQKGVQSPPQQPINDVTAMQAIVIRTSQSMTNLQTVFKQQIEARKNKQRLANKKLERKYKDSLDEASEQKQKSSQDEDEDDEEDKVQVQVPWKLRITRKKSRSLEQNELRATLRKDGGKFHRLSLPTHQKQTKNNNNNQYKYRQNKHRSNTLGSNVTTSATLSNHHPVHSVRFAKPQKPSMIHPVTPQKQQQQQQPQQQQQMNNNDMNNNNNDSDQSPNNSPIHRLKHQKSLSSPSMNLSINTLKHQSVINGGRGYHPSPVHEDYEHNEQQILSNQHFYDSSSSTFNGNQQWRTNSKSSTTNIINGNGQSSLSYTNSAGHHEKKHSNSFSINTNEHSQSFTNEDLQTLNVNDENHRKISMATDTVIEDKSMD